jgi:hypothetical protein
MLSKASLIDHRILEFMADVALAKTNRPSRRQGGADGRGSQQFITATEKKEWVEACPFAGIIQIKFNGISQIESCRSNHRTPVMLLQKLTLSTYPPIQKIKPNSIVLRKSTTPSSSRDPTSRRFLSPSRQSNCQSRHREREKKQVARRSPNHGLRPRCQSCWC